MQTFKIQVERKVVTESFVTYEVQAETLESAIGLINDGQEDELSVDVYFYDVTEKNHKLKETK